MDVGRPRKVKNAKNSVDYGYRQPGINKWDDAAPKIAENTTMRIYRHNWGLLSLIGLMSLLAACSAPKVERPTSAVDWSVVETVLAAGFDGISSKYIDPLTIDAIAFNGLTGLSTIDPEFTTHRANGSITLNYAGTPIAETRAPGAEAVDAWAKLTTEFAIAARQHSIDMRAADAEQVYEAVFDGILAKLDVYSRYAGAEEARRNRAQRDGFGGIGARFILKEEILRISEVRPDTPAARSDLKVDDIITHIDHEPVRGLSMKQITSKIRGPLQTPVILGISRKDLAQPYEVELVRTHIVPPTVSEQRLGGILYLKIKSFNQDTARSLSEKLEMASTAMGAELTGVVIDLRGNPGGLLKQSVKAADLFLTRGHIISTQGRHIDSLHSYEAGGEDLAAGLPLFVLIDGKTASAAEIIAAALQDRERAVVIGTSSYGKGTVQTVLRLPNEGEIVLTWSRLIAPSGYTLHGMGVRPAVCTASEDAEAHRSVNEMIANHLAAKAIFDQWRASGIQKIERRKRLRETCPPGVRSSDLELEVAKQLTQWSHAYARALSISATTHQAQN